MTAKDIKIDWFGNRLVCYGGVGKMFYQEGFPISMMNDLLRKADIELSILHVADECLKNGWSPKTVITKLKDEFADDFYGKYDLELVAKFCNSEYCEQREMIFQYFFGCTTDDVRSKKNTEPLNWVQAYIDKNILSEMAQQ